MSVSLIPQSPLFGALALQVGLIDAATATHQRHLKPATGPYYRPAGPTRPTPAALPDQPGVYLASPADACWQHNVGAFLSLLDAPFRSWNCYNDHAPFAGAAVLACGRTPTHLFHEPGPLRPSSYPLAPGRSDESGRGFACLENLVSHYQRVLGVAGFDQRAPVLLDSQGRILDGWHRLMACQQLNLPAYFVQLDY